MREGIGLVGIFQIVILFILLFTGIMALTINNTNAFGVKDEIVNIIDFNDGVFFDGEGNLSSEITDAMEANSYRNTGRCAEGYTGYDRNGSVVDSSPSVCIKCVDVTKGLDNYYDRYNGNIASSDSLFGYYFQVQVFYQLDLPVFGDTFNFNTKGESKIIYSRQKPEICR